MALVAVVALAAAVVQASTGLGFALILSPAVFALLEPESAVVAITVLGLALNGLVLFGERRRPRVAWGEVRPILLAAGGRAWLRRRFTVTLSRLAQTVAERQAEAATSPGRAARA